MKITVFCSANDDIDSIYFERTEELGRWLAAQRHTLVYGGCDKGLMRSIGRSVHAAGGRTIGIVPRLVEKEARSADYLDVFIPVDNLSERKDLMIAQGDILLALPGGIGTLDEVFTVLAAHAIGYTTKKVILYNINGYWDSLLLLLRDMAEKRTLRGTSDALLTVVQSLDDLIVAIGSH